MLLINTNILGGCPQLKSSLPHAFKIEEASLNLPHAYVNSSIKL